MGTPRRAGVSSFGISGTNAHVILEQPPPRWRWPEAPGGQTESEDIAVGCGAVGGVGASPVSALAAQAGRLLGVGCALMRGWIRVDVGCSLARRARRLSIARWWSVRIAPALMAGLAGLAGWLSGCWCGGQGRAGSVGKTVMVFPGQGAQWVGMGRELLDASPVFAEQMRRVLRRWGRGWSGRCWMWCVG